MQIAIASGKGGTGKTFLATNLAVILKEELGKRVTYLDCDVEEPNGHLFIQSEKVTKKEVMIRAPVAVDAEKCTTCGRCAEVCMYNALAHIRESVLLFPELCQVCGACTLVCPEDAIIEGQRAIGEEIHGCSEIDIYYANLARGEGGMSPRLIKRVREHSAEGVNILDSPPGTACPVVESVLGTDLCVLVTDPTPFGVHDLRLAANMCRTLHLEPVVVVNRAEYRDGTLKEYCRQAALQIIGEIPNDREMARVYSRGKLVVEELPQYRTLFQELAQKILELAGEERPAAAPDRSFFYHSQSETPPGTAGSKPTADHSGKGTEEFVIISGKGGTGKTSLAAAFTALAGNTVVADCDVDASDLPLLFNPEIQESGWFTGGFLAEIDPGKCSACGLCQEMCRFDAIRKQDTSQQTTYIVDSLHCEGCGVCKLVCEQGAVELYEAQNGQWFVSKIKYGTMAHARLGIAEENSGLLVTLTRQKAEKLSVESDTAETIIDGSPGTGCPVIASLTGARYAVVVTEPTVSGLHDMRRILELTEFLDIPAGVVINKWDINQDMAEKIRRYVCQEGVEFLGQLPYDERVTQAQMRRKSIVEYAPECDLSLEIKAIWNRLRPAMSHME